MSRKRATTDGVNGRDGEGELPPLPKGWCWTAVGEIGKVQLGRQRSPKNRSDKYPTKYLRAANITWEGLDLTDVLDMDFKPSELPTYRLQPGDILLSEASGSVDEVGKPAVWKDEIEDCCFQNTVIRFRPVEMPPDFPLLVFRHFARNKVFAKVAHGVGIHHLGADRFSKMPFPLPPLREQARIAAKADELLTELDAGIATLKRVRTTLKLYRASVLKAAVEGRLTEEWRAKHPDVEPGSALLDRILTERRRRWEERELAKYARAAKQPPKGWQSKYIPSPELSAEGLPILPNGWCWASLGQLLIEPTCNGISVKGSDMPPGIAALRLSAMSDKGFDYSLRRYLPIDDSTAEQLAIREGDFFVSRGNGSLRLVGRGTLAQLPGELVVFPDTMIRLRVCDDGPLRKYLSLIWGSRLLRRQIEKRARTTAGIYKISQKDIESFFVALPPSAEQVEIVKEIERRFSVLDEIEAQVKANLVRADRLRQSILKRAFEGRLVPQDADDEPAARLLKRIRSRAGSAPTAEAKRPSKQSREASTGEVLPLFRTIAEDR